MPKVRGKGKRTGRGKGKGVKSAKTNTINGRGKKRPPTRSGKR